MAEDVLSLGAATNYYVEEDFEFVMLDSSVYNFSLDGKLDRDDIINICKYLMKKKVVVRDRRILF